MSVRIDSHRIAESLPTPLAIGALQMEFSTSHPEVHLWKAFRVCDLMLAYAENVLRAQRKEPPSSAISRPESMGQRLRVVDTLCRELGREEQPAACLWSNASGRRSIEGLIGWRNRVSHQTALASTTAKNWRKAVDDVWRALAFLTESTLLLWSPATNDFLALRGPGGLHAPKVHSFARPETEIYLRGNTRSPSTVESAFSSTERSATGIETDALPHLFLDRRDGRPIALFPFLAYRRAAHGQHRVLFLSWKKEREFPFWDPLDDEEDLGVR